jgi:hypothetical protein
MLAISREKSKHVSGLVQGGQLYWTILFSKGSLTRVAAEYLKQIG